MKGASGKKNLAREDVLSEGGHSAGKQMSQIALWQHSKREAILWFKRKAHRRHLLSSETQDF